MFVITFLHCKTVNKSNFGDMRYADVSVSTYVFNTEGHVIALLLLPSTIILDHHISIGVI